MSTIPPEQHATGKKVESPLRGPVVLHSIFISLCLIVSLVPLPFGTDRPLPWSILGIATGLLLACSLLLPERFLADEISTLRWPAALFSLVVGFALIQLSPWIPAALQNPVWEQAAATLHQSVEGGIALDRSAGFAYLLRLMSYAGVFYLAWLTGRAERSRIALELVSLTGCFYAVYGLIVYWSGNQTVLWFPKIYYGDDLTGPFINRNSFATYLGLCLVATLALLIESTLRTELHGDWRRKLIAVAELLSRRTIRILMLFLIATALFLTHSRGGLLATLSGIAALLLAIWLAPSLGRIHRVGIWGLAPLAIFFFALVISGGGVFARFVADSDSSERLAVYQLTLQAIGDYPVLGIGLGSFAALFPVYRTAAIIGNYDLAHNDYLQNILELGIPVALCLFASLGWLIAICLRGIRIRRRDAIYPCLGFAMSVLVGVHATVDFSLQIPAVTVLYLFVLGIAVAQSRSSRHAGDAWT
jgi:O-antigen ligase